MIGSHDAAGNAAWAPLYRIEPAEADASQDHGQSRSDGGTEPSSRLDRVLTRVSVALGMCGHGAPLNWWVRVADTFFIDCGCCWFWRGVALGLVAGVPTGAVTAWLALIILGG